MHAIYWIPWINWWFKFPYVFRDADLSYLGYCPTNVSSQLSTKAKRERTNNSEIPCKSSKAKQGNAGANKDRRSLAEADPVTFVNQLSMKLEKVRQILNSSFLSEFSLVKSFISFTIPRPVFLFYPWITIRHLTTFIVWNGIFNRNGFYRMILLIFTISPTHSHTSDNMKDNFVSFQVGLSIDG